MNKIVKVTEDKIFIGKDDGSLVEAGRASANWEVKVGDEVEIFTSGDEIILSLAKKVKDKKIIENKAVKWVVKNSQKLLPIVFSAVFVFFTIALIVICSVPRGWKYVYREEVAGVEVESIVEFDDDELTLTTYSNMMTEEDEIDAVVTSKYKITDGKLYTYNLTTEQYNYAGKISSTKAVIENEGFKIEYKEETMCALRAVAIVFMVISAILDAGAIAVMILTKKGILKLETAPTTSALETATETKEETVSE